MVVPLVMLLILAFVVIRSLMVVVGQEDVPAATAATEHVATGVPGMPAPQLRARADDGVRGLLLPTVADMEFVHDPAHSDAS